MKNIMKLALGVLLIVAVAGCAVGVGVTDPVYTDDYSASVVVTDY